MVNGLKKGMALLLSLLTAGNIAFISATAVNDPPQESEEASEKLSIINEETELPQLSHAYDPIEEEKEKAEYRSNTDFLENKIIFSVRENRGSKNASVGLNDKSDLCKTYNLADVKMIYETKLMDSSDDTGTNSYEVFYEAKTKDDDIWGLADKLSKESSVISAEPDFLWTKSADLLPSAVSEEELKKSTVFSDVGMTNTLDNLKSRNILPGQDVVVAVIDSGVDYLHEELASQMWKNPGEIPDNGIDDDNNGFIDDIYGYDFVEDDNDPMDDHGHGTHVAGIIAMSANGKGGLGVSYGAKIMALKAGQSTGVLSVSDIAKAIRYASVNGADVINMSFCGIERSALIEAALKDASANCVLVAAAGNGGSPTSEVLGGYNCYPAGYQYVLGVMATDKKGNIASFSNWDYLQKSGCEYEIAAPGTDIYSTLPGNRYAVWSGTSMAASVVSASAAIMRSYYPDKSRYSSRFIMGQLVSANNSKALFESGTVKRSYPRLNIDDSINSTQTPEVILRNFYMFDDPAVSEKNNGDGIAQPGEVIDIAVSAFNYYGIASDVTVKIDAISIGGVPNPHVEFLNDTIHLSDIGTFSTQDNDWIYQNGELTGTANPLRIRIKEDTTNDIQIKFNFTVTAKNGLDENDTTVYSSDFEQSYMIIVQNGYVLSGIIHEDMTLTADKYWIIQNNVLIPEGVTVRVEPGTQIQFWSAVSDSPYTLEPDVFLQVEGKFICEGTEDKPIEMFPGKSFEDKDVLIFEKALSGEDPGFNDKVILKYVNILNPGYKPPMTYFRASLMDHCRLIYNFTVYSRNANLEVKKVTHSIFQNCNGFLRTYEFDTSIFSDFSSKISNFTYDKLSVKNSVFLNNYHPQDNFLSLKMGFENEINPSKNFEFKNNAVLGNFNLYPKEKIRFIGTGMNHDEYDISGNYWGTEIPELVKAQCLDKDWNVSLDQAIQEPFLTVNDDLSSIYPFVTEAYITDENGDRIVKAGAQQEVTLHVCFNRDMAQDIQPMVNYGPAEPYTDYTVRGDWITPREWTGSFVIDPFINLGRMYIRVKNAAAADDRWLKTCTDEARFFFEIEGDSVQSMSLKADSKQGINHLSWMQDDYETLAGYNIYRSTDYDPEKTIDEQHWYFKKINSLIISDDECFYNDKDVISGETYYYYFTVVDTQFNESPPSHVVYCTPEDPQAPVIKHTPVTASKLYTPFTIRAEITDNVKVLEVILHYREAGGEWGNYVLSPPQNGNVYELRMNELTDLNSTAEYYITAKDSVHTTYCGTEDDPFIIQCKEEHNWVKGDVLSSPTCTKEGEQLLRCSDCGETNTVSIPVTEHKYDQGHLIKMNTCTVDGIMEYICTECGASYEESVPANGHQFTDTVLAPTCHSWGCTVHQCEKCGLMQRDQFIPPTPHAYTKQIIQQPGCTVPGSVHYVCDSCGEEYYTDLPMTEHDLTDETIAPTCTHGGYTSHLCRNCGYYYTDNFTPMTDHAFDEGAITVEPTYFSTGIREYTCNSCGIKKQEIIPVLQIPKLINESFISSDNVTAGTSVTLTAKASGGSGSYTYALLYKKSTSSRWSKIGTKYGKNNIGSFTPSKAVNYDIMINVKDSMGNVKSRTFKLTVSTASTLRNISTVSSTDVAKGTKVTLNAAAEGGTGEYTYALMYKKHSSSQWVKIGKKYGTASTGSFTPGSAVAYDILINVKDSSGKIKSKALTLNVH